MFCAVSRRRGLQESETSLPLPQRLLAAAVVVTALYFGRDLLIPLALAIAATVVQ